MLRKTIRAARGLLAEPSVVQRPGARFLGGVPNAALGLAYYVTLAIAVWSTESPRLWLGAIVASALAAAVSVRLAFSLLYVTRMPCSYCWTSHAVNWLLILCTILNFCNLSYWR